MTVGLVVVVVVVTASSRLAGMVTVCVVPPIVVAKIVSGGMVTGQPGREGRQPVGARDRRRCEHSQGGEHRTTRTEQKPTN